MNRNVQDTESSLLLQLPKSVLSFSDMSGNSFLLPVAVENVAGSENLQDDSNCKKQGESSKVTEPSSVCQLQQPLLMRRGSSPGPKMAVPYSESSVQTINVPSGVQTGMTCNFTPSQPPVSNVGSIRQSNGSSIWPSAADSQLLQSNTVFTGFQNQPPSVQSEIVSQSSSSLPKSLNQDNEGYQCVFSSESSVPSSANYPGNIPVMTSAYPPFSEKTSDYQNFTSATEYFSQPPVITPSSAPVYFNNSGRNVSQVPYPNVSHQNFDVPSSRDMNSDLYSRVYEAVKPYWLFKDVVETKEIWCGFSNVDSDKLEMFFQQDPQAVVPVDGGRYDALLSERIKKPVYFEAKDLEIRRCTWFYRSCTTQRFSPFSEEASNMLEKHYSACLASGQWPYQLSIPNGGSVVLENPQLFFYYKNEDVWPSLPDSKANPITVKRGLPDTFEIMCSENGCIDHLVFIVQGIGSFCDLRFRTVAECVDGFRDIANKLLASHFRCEVENGKVGRVEFLPLAWHAKLHTSDQGFDRRMQNITLPSIPKLRHFTNDTLLDILLYSSPFYCQTIINTVATELNKLYEIFLKRNPGFSGKVFVAGHSLGSLILFDILSHQSLDDTSNITCNESKSDEDSKSEIKKCDAHVTSEDNIKEAYDSLASLLQACQLEEYSGLFEKEKIDLSSVSYLSDDDLKELGIPTGPRKKLLNAVHVNKNAKYYSHDDGEVSKLLSNIPPEDQNTFNVTNTEENPESIIFPFKTSPCMSSIVYPRLHFEPACFFALGSPISMFLTVRGYDSISEHFRFPTCSNFFHIFHPYDPVAFRIEPLIDPNFSIKPVLIPHHKGRKRMHLEIRENLSKVGFEIKQKVLETIRYTWNSLSGFATAHRFPTAAVEAEVDKLVDQQMSGPEYEHQTPSEICGEELQIGSLNGGRRIDYVLQEKPIEALNDYIFALTSHATYWDSEDTVLMILREIYATQGILVSSQSVLENKEFSHFEHSPYETYSQLNSVMSNPSLYKSSNFEQLPTNVLLFSNQSVASVPGSSKSMHSLNDYAVTAPHVASNDPSSTITQIPLAPPPPTMTQPVFPPPTMTQPVLPPPTVTQLVLPPPSTMVQQLGGPASTTMTQQSIGPSPSTMAQQSGGPAPTTITQQPMGPAPTTMTQQPMGPPPLTGFVKRSPFSR